jgi:hypothetical protein
MDITEHRDKLGIFILFSNLGLFVLIILLWFFKGFDDGEFQSVLKYLIPIKSIYLSAVIKYSLRNRLTGKAAVGGGQPLQPFYWLMTRTMIYLHIGLLYAMILLYALGGLGFAFLDYGIPAVEAFFGIYIGMIVGDLFTTGKFKRAVS